MNGQLDIAGRTIKVIISFTDFELCNSFGYQVYFLCISQVSSVTDQSGAQEVGATAADFDDDDGAGLVNYYFAYIT